MTAAARDDRSIGFRRGEVQAVSAVRARVQRILAYRGYGIPPQDRADLEQEVLAQLWRATAARKFRDRGFWGFVETVATRRCIDWWRTRKTTISVDRVKPPEEHRGGPLDRLIGRERVELAEAAMARLDRTCQELIRLRLRDDLTFAEISDRLGRSSQALRTQMFRCVQRASRVLAEIQGEPAGPSPESREGDFDESS